MAINPFIDEQISSATGIAQNTIRTHLKSIFQKTGVQRQAELASLLGVAINHTMQIWRRS